MDKSTLVKEAIKAAYERAKAIQQALVEEKKEVETKEVIKPTKPGTYCYTPEMGQEKPDCQIEAGRGHYGRHYYIDTPLELKGRGIKFLRTYTEKDLTSYAARKIGWNQYQVTELAFEKLERLYTISMKLCLD